MRAKRIHVPATWAVRGTMVIRPYGYGLWKRARPAQIQVVLAIKGGEAVSAKVRELRDRLRAAGLRVHVDDRTDTWRTARRCRPADVSTTEEAVMAVGRRWPGVRPWTDLGEEGEARPAKHAVTVRCLVAADGPVPEADDATGNVAVVARAY